MNMVESITIRRLPLLDDAASLPGLSRLLVDCVNAGASVGFLAPLQLSRAEAFWRKVAQGVADGDRLLLVAEAHGAAASVGQAHAPRIVGTVHLVVGQPDNQAHRADVSKLLVHPQARRQGVADRLMQAVETQAQRIGKTLLVLDTACDSDAERLYQRRGWQPAGRIPGYALTFDGISHGTSIFYKALGG